MIEEFVKPRKVFVDVKDYLESLLPSGLEKDLHENEDFSEEICETCHGTGFAKADNNYGLTDDPNRSPFPYKHESLWWCPHCYNGVVRRCKHCGKLLPKGRLKCDCETIREREEKEREQALLEAWNKAEELGPDALGTKFGMCYSDRYTHNEGYFTDWDDFFDAWGGVVFDNEGNEPSRPEFDITIVNFSGSNPMVAGDYDLFGATDLGHLTTAGLKTDGYNNITLNATGVAAISKTGVTKFGLRSSYVWGTREVEMHIDAGNIVENATCDLYEDAGDNISDKAMIELQTFLNDWCAKCGVGKTYCESHRYKVRIPWEEYERREQDGR